jgi:glc operon protein GlcG
MMARPVALASAALLVGMLSAPALAQAPAPAQAPTRPSYGPTITLEAAKKAGAGAMAEARKNNWAVAVAVVDNHGMLIYYEMMDDTQTAAATIAVEKARTAAMFRRPGKDFQDRVAAGDHAVLGLPGATPIDGGVPILVGGKVIGGVGVSGMAGAQDGVVAKAGADALK